MAASNPAKETKKKTTRVFSFHYPELEKRGVLYKPLEDLLVEADIVSLQVPLCPETKH